MNISLILRPVEISSEWDGSPSLFYGDMCKPRKRLQLLLGDAIQEKVQNNDGKH